MHKAKHYANLKPGALGECNYKNEPTNNTI